MTHIVLDLETMGTASDAAIVAIGAVRIDPAQLGDTFYRTVSLKSSQRGGGTIDADTVMWWFDPMLEEARAALMRDAVLIEVALKEFADWVREKPLVGMWGNGADFDNVVLASAYSRSGKTPPWTYRENRCYRTLRALFPEIKKDEDDPGLLPHHALGDALMEAKHLLKIWAAMQ